MNRFFSGLVNGNKRRNRRNGFTLVEILVATSLLVVISLFLVEIANQSARAWTQGEHQSNNRQRAQVALDFMGRELQQALLSSDPINGPLEFVIDPTAVTSFPNRDTIFWQAPVATDASRGDLAEVGYFVRWTGTQASLCRFFVNPSDTANYHLYDTPSPSQWVSDSILNTVAPADKTDHYQGLFLENVIGLWVQAYQVDGTAYLGDSRTAGHLPAFVQISLALIDTTIAARLTASQASTVQAGYKNASTAEMLVASLPATIRAGASVVTIRVSPANYK